MDWRSNWSIKSCLYMKLPVLKKEYAIFLICVMNLFSKPRFQHLKFALSLNLSPTNFLLTRLII